jgi:hypothetical protein
MVILLAAIAAVEAGMLLMLLNRYNRLLASLVAQVNPKAAAAVSKSVALPEHKPPRRQVGLDGGNV